MGAAQNGVAGIETLELHGLELRRPGLKVQYTEGCGGTVQGVTISSTSVALVVLVVRQGLQTPPEGS